MQPRSAPEDRPEGVSISFVAASVLGAEVCRVCFSALVCPPQAPVVVDAAGCVVGAVIFVGSGVFPSDVVLFFFFFFVVVVVVVVSAVRFLRGEAVP
jgi:hypothetical protein